MRRSRFSRLLPSVLSPFTDRKLRTITFSDNKTYQHMGRPSTSGWGLAALVLLVVMVVALRLTSGSRRGARP
jgi:hypothetical protein